MRRANLRVTRYGGEESGSEAPLAFRGFAARACDLNVRLLKIPTSFPGSSLYLQRKDPGCGFTAVKRKKQENYFKDKVFIFSVQSLILKKYSPSLLNFLELY